MFIVYSLTIVNKKQYVGWTSLTLDKRWKEHCSGTRRKRFKNQLLKRAISKYGEECWTREILETVESEQKAKQAEIFWILKKNSYAFASNGHGYNMTQGGDGKSGSRLSEETKKKISESLKGNRCGAGNKGKVVLDDVKKKISKSLQGRKRPEREKLAVSNGLRRAYAEGRR